MGVLTFLGGDIGEQRGTKKKKKKIKYKESG